LDELNGLVLAGEIALERLQRAGERRVETADRVFAPRALPRVETRRSDVAAADLDTVIVEEYPAFGPHAVTQ
jgi:hypothetical protein